MTQYFNIRVKRNNTGEELASPELISELFAYLVEHPYSVVEVTEDVQARGLGESIEEPERPE
jgi:hypothetical protein